MAFEVSRLLYQQYIKRNQALNLNSLLGAVWKDADFCQYSKARNKECYQPRPVSWTMGTACKGGVYPRVGMGFGQRRRDPLTITAWCNDPRGLHIGSKAPNALVYDRWGNLQNGCGV